jgi:hypothetical protein
MENSLTNNVVSPVAPAIDMGTSLPMIITTAVITVFMIGLSLYIIIKIPSTLIKASKKVVQTATENATPLLLHAQNKKDTKKNRIKLTPLLTMIMKIILVFIPVIFSFMSQYLEKQTIDFYIAIFVGILLACFSLLFFVFQYLIAELLMVKKQDIL